MEEEANDIDSEKKNIQQGPEEIELENEEKAHKNYNRYIQYILANKFILIALIIIIVTIFLVVNDDHKEEIEIKENWDISYKKAEKFINKLNLTEQINLLFGTQNMKIQSILIENESEKKYLCEGLIDPFKNSKVNFKGMCLQDGPAGVRFSNGTSISWQAGINNAATFNRKLMKKVGKAQGEELKIKGINTVLGPVANILRSPQGGRGWEAYGDDPFYTGVCASEYIKGIQSEGVIANIKHFVGNDQETYRKASSSNMDLATLMDIYVEPFYRAIKDANVGSIMSAFNAINNTYCAESKFILTDILRNILGFRGFVVSDWWGVFSDHPNTINSGLDLNMPGGYNGNPRGEENCCDRGNCKRMNLPSNSGNYNDCFSVHAEQNAIIHASRDDMLGSILYLVGKDVKTGNYVENASACSMCKRMIINAGIEKVVIRNSKEHFTVIDVKDWIINDESVQGVFGY